MSKKMVYLVLQVGKDNPNLFNIYEISKQEENDFRKELYKKISECINMKLKNHSLFIIENLNNLNDIVSEHKHSHPGLLVKLKIDESQIGDPISESELFPDILNASNKKILIIKEGTLITEDSIKLVNRLKDDEYKNTHTKFFNNENSMFKLFWREIFPEEDQEKKTIPSFQSE